MKKKVVTISKIMKPKFYIIPGWEETCERKQYQNLAKEIQGLGFEIVFKNINWKEKLSKQTFNIEPNSILFGFSSNSNYRLLLIWTFFAAVISGLAFFVVCNLLWLLDARVYFFIDRLNFVKF